MKKRYKDLLTIAFLLIGTFFIETIILNKSIMEIEWGIYLTMFVSSVIATFVINKRR